MKKKYAQQADYMRCDLPAEPWQARRAFIFETTNDIKQK
jgi:hypothetical protein